MSEVAQQAASFGEFEILLQHIQDGAGQYDVPLNERTGHEMPLAAARLLMVTLSATESGLQITAGGSRTVPLGTALMEQGFDLGVDYDPKTGEAIASFSFASESDAERARKYGVAVTDSGEFELIGRRELIMPPTARNVHDGYYSTPVVSRARSAFFSSVLQEVLGLAQAKQG